MKFEQAPTCSGNGSLAHRPLSFIPVWFSHCVTCISNHVTFSATRERFLHPGTLASLSALLLKVANCISPPLFSIRQPHLGHCLASSIAPGTWPMLKNPVWLVTPLLWVTPWLDPREFSKNLTLLCTGVRVCRNRRQQRAKLERPFPFTMT